MLWLFDPGAVAHKRFHEEIAKDPHGIDLEILFRDLLILVFHGRRRKHGTLEVGVSLSSVLLHL